MIICTLSLINTRPDEIVLRKIRRFVFSAFTDALLLWGVLHLISTYTLHNLPQGQTYIFTPSGLGLFIDAFQHIIVFTGLYVVYCLTSFLARPWLAWIYRSLMFCLFVVFLTYMILTKIVAAVIIPDGRMFLYPHYPFSPRHVASPPRVIYKKNSIVTALSLDTGIPEDGMFYPVSNFDTATQDELQRFLEHALVVQRTKE